MRLVLGPLFDPAFEQLDLPRRQRLATLGGRHLIGRISGLDPASQLTLTELPRHERRDSGSQLRLGVFGHIQPQPRLPRLLIGAVTGKTVVRQNRPDVAIEFEGLVGGEDRERTHHTKKCCRERNGELAIHREECPQAVGEV